MFDIKSRLFNRIQVVLLVAASVLFILGHVLYTPKSQPFPSWLSILMFSFVALAFTLPLFDYLYRQAMKDVSEDFKEFNPQSVKDWEDKWNELLSTTRVQRMLDNINYVLVAHSSMPLEAEQELASCRRQLQEDLDYLKPSVRDDHSLIAVYDSYLREQERNPGDPGRHIVGKPRDIRTSAIYRGAQAGMRIMRCTATLQEIAHKYGYAATA